MEKSDFDPMFVETSFFLVYIIDKLRERYILSLDHVCKLYKSKYVSPYK